MATIIFKNAIALFNGADVSVALHELSVDYKAELLDETSMGDDTRIRKGGLRIGTLAGKGYFDGLDTGIEQIMFAGIGDASGVTTNKAFQAAAVLEDTIVVVFPDGITEGSNNLAGSGYAMKGVLGDFKIGGAVGALLDVSFAAESRGIDA